MVLARWKTAAYTGSSEPRRLAEVVKQMEVSMSLATEEDFRPQKASTKRGSTTSGQTWEVDVGKKMDLERALRYWETSGQRSS